MNSLKSEIEETIRILIFKYYEYNDYNVLKTSKMSGISRNTIIKYLGSKAKDRLATTRRYLDTNEV